MWYVNREMSNEKKQQQLQHTHKKLLTADMHSTRAYGGRVPSFHISSAVPLE